MNEKEIRLTIENKEYVAFWHDKKDDRCAEWYVYLKGDRIFRFPGILSSRTQVEERIRKYHVSGQ